LVITDLGLGHHKIARELGQSKTSRKDGTDEYSAPETAVGRSFDVFAMGCIGCEVLVWLKDGAAGVKKFHEDRKHSEQEPGGAKAIVYNFHCGKDSNNLQPAVIAVLLEAKNNGGLSGKVAEILEDMLIRESAPPHDPGKSPKTRPKAIEAANRFRTLLDQCPLPTTTIPANSELKNPKHSHAEVYPSVLLIQPLFDANAGSEL
jgi:hypothetical protein